MKIYVVTQGEYSAYHIVGVTLDRAKAERWVELYNAEDRIYHRDAQIEEYEADEFGNDGMYLWEVSQGWGEEEVRVTEVRQGLVTMVGDDAVYQITEDESWRVGDRAEAIVRDGKIVEVRWVK